MNSDLTDKKRNNTNQFEENMPNIAYDSLGDEKRHAWRKKFSNVIRTFFSGGSYKKPLTGPSTSICRVREATDKPQRIVTEAKGVRSGSWSARGNAKHNALRSLKKRLGRRFNPLDYVFEYIDSN